MSDTWTDKHKMWEVFHFLRTRDVGTDGYDKKKWISLEANIQLWINRYEDALKRIESIREQASKIKDEFEELKWIVFYDTGRCGDEDHDVGYEEYDTREEAEEHIRQLEVYAFTTCVLVQGTVIDREKPE